MRFFDDLREAVVVDLETTGFDSKTDRIVQVALIKIDFSGVTTSKSQIKCELLHYKVNPQRAIPTAATKINGITNMDVRDEKPFSEIASELRDFIGELPLVAHNVSFDKRFLSEEFRRAGLKSVHRNKSYCTMMRFREANNGRRKGSGLDNVGHVLGINGRSGKYHDAVEDCTIAAKVAGLMYVNDAGIAPTLQNIAEDEDDRLDDSDVMDAKLSLTQQMAAAVICFLIVVAVLYTLF